jgi:hypothetical protein
MMCDGSCLENKILPWTVFYDGDDDCCHDDVRILIGVLPCSLKTHLMLFSRLHFYFFLSPFLLYRTLTVVEGYFILWIYTQPVGLHG